VGKKMMLEHIEQSTKDSLKVVGVAS